MKSFIIHINDHNKSVKNAKDCLKSCKDTGFDPILFNGVTPYTLNQWDVLDNLGPIKGSRADNLRKYYQLLLKGKCPKCKKWKDKGKCAKARKNCLESKRYLYKKSCFLNHIRLWKICVQINEPISVLEHDSRCIKEWDDIEFEDLLILNIKSAFKQRCFKSIYDKCSKFSKRLKNGVNFYKNSPLTLKGHLFEGGYHMPGTAAYSVTPVGAKKLLKELKNGWNQSDFYINTKLVNIQYAVPEYFTFCDSNNLQTSHGFQIEKTPKVFVACAYSGENEFEESQKSIDNQNNVEVHKFVVKNKGILEALNEVYQEWEKVKHDFDMFVTVDPDMVILNNDFIRNTWNWLQNNPQYNMFISPVLDFLSNTNIYGIRAYLPSVRFNLCKNKYNPDNEFDKSSASIKLVDIKKEAPVSHASSPSVRSAFHYGWHRELRSELKRICRDSIKNLRKAAKKTNHPMRKHAVAGADAALRYKSKSGGDISPIEYTSDIFISEFDEYLKEIDVQNG